MGTRVWSLWAGMGSASLCAKCQLAKYSSVIISFLPSWTADRSNRRRNLQFISRKPGSASPPFLLPCSCLFELETSLAWKVFLAWAVGAAP